MIEQLSLLDLPTPAVAPRGRLRRAGVLEPLPSPDPWQPAAYLLHLDGTGVAASRPGG